MLSLGTEPPPPPLAEVPRARQGSISTPPHYSRFYTQEHRKLDHRRQKKSPSHDTQYTVPNAYLFRSPNIAREIPV